MKQIKLLAISLLLGLGLVGLTPMVSVYAQDDICSDPAMDPELLEAAGCNTEQTLDSVVTTLISVVLGLIGILAVCVMIYGGITYVTSAGSPEKTMRARNIILYGLVGLVVAGLAYAIVYFVSQVLGGV